MEGRVSVVVNLPNLPEFVVNEEGISRNGKRIEAIGDELMTDTEGQNTVVFKCEVTVGPKPKKKPSEDEEPGCCGSPNKRLRHDDLNLITSLTPLSPPSSASPQPPQVTVEQNSTESGAPSLSTAMGNNPGNADPEKRKLIQQQLVLLLHAGRCQRKNGEQRQCDLPHCQTIKNVLSHMATCEAGKTCTETHCSSSRLILSHWKYCTRLDCPVCLPLKLTDRNLPNAQAPPQAQIPINPQQSQHSPSPTPTPSDVRRAYDALGIPCPPTQNNPLLGNVNVPPGANPVPNMMQQQRMRGPSSVQASPVPQQGPITPSAPSPRLPSASPQPPQIAVQQNSTESGVSSQAPPQDYVALQLNTTQNGGVEIDSILGLDGSGIHPPNQNPEIIATPVERTKDWHQSTSSELRNHLVEKLVHAIFPSPDQNAMLDRRMGNLIAYAKKVEGDMYEMANSRPEYYHLLADKIYKIQTELEEKRQKRKKRKQEMQNAADAIVSSSNGETQSLALPLGASGEPSTIVSSTTNTSAPPVSSVNSAINTNSRVTIPAQEVVIAPMQSDTSCVTCATVLERLSALERQFADHLANCAKQKQP